MDVALILASETDLFRIQDINLLFQLIPNVLEDLEISFGFTILSINSEPLFSSKTISKKILIKNQSNDHHLI